MRHSLHLLYPLPTMKRIPAYHRWWRYKSLSSWCDAACTYGGMPGLRLPYGYSAPASGTGSALSGMQPWNCGSRKQSVYRADCLCADNLDSDGFRLQYGVYPCGFVRRDIDFVVAANDAAFDFAGLWFLAEVMFILTFGAPLLFLLLCLYVYTALIREKAYPALRLRRRVLVRLRSLDHGGCVFHFHFGGVYQALVRCYGRVWLGVFIWCFRCRSCWFGLRYRFRSIGFIIRFTV